MNMNKYSVINPAGISLLLHWRLGRLSAQSWGDKKHQAGKYNKQKIKPKNLNYRIWIKGLAGKTICARKLEQMQNVVIGLLINNKVGLDLDIQAEMQI